MSPHPEPQLQGYAIRRQLGAGGMGVVYLAHDVKLERSVAIKVLSGDFASDHARIRRFEQEARAASALSHPNVCVVYALGETAGAEPFIAMEYIEGQTLRHLLQTRRPALKTALDIAIQIAAGVGSAHAIGIVHRDLKPENVIVRDDGLVKVLDFGLAKLAGGAMPSDGSEATRTLVKTDAGVVMGTYTYMAPEQARGQDVDARADIWALGVILYELVSGRVPFTGDTRSDVIVSILERDPAPLDKLNPGVPHELQRIVAKALRKDRAQRYQTITDLRLDLDVLRSELQVSSTDAAPVAVPAAPSATTPQPVRRESSAEYILTSLARHKLAAAAGLLVIAALAAGAVWRTRRGTPDGSAAVASRVQRNLTRLTFGGGLQTDPTLSPDGRFLAYASDRAGNFDIWVQPVAGGNPVQVTKEPESDTQPAWSPDGSTIVFRSEKNGGGLFAVPALGGPHRQLTSFGERPTWSHSGTEVLFLTGPFVNTAEGQARFYAVPAEGGVPKELAASVLEHGTWKWIAEHPDGRISAVGRYEAQGEGFYTFSRSGEHMVKSNVAAAPELLNRSWAARFRFSWNRTGTRLYIEATMTVINNLWRVEVDPTTLAWRSAERLTAGGGSDINAVLSPDETRIAYVQQASSVRLWSFPFDAAEGRLTGEGAAFSEDGAFAADVDLSRDGSAALFSPVRPGGLRDEIWVHHFDTSQQQLLVADGTTPKWVPGGNSIVYTKYRNKNTNKTESTLMLREPNGTERQLSPWSATRDLLATDGSGDGHSMLVSAWTRDATPLWLWSVEGFSDKPKKILIDRPGGIWQAHFSPNGRWLAFVRSTVGIPVPQQVVVARMEPTPITEWTPVAPGLSITDKPRWAPDGRILYFLTSRNGFYNLAGVRFDPDRGVAVGQPFDVTHFTAPSLTVVPLMDRCEIDIAAHRVVLPMVSSTGSVWMLDNVDR
jgi:eukaryotic-like serine/threonine-protein kinase